MFADSMSMCIHVHTVTYHPGQHFAKEMEVDEVVWIDRGAWTGPEETIHTLEQSILWIDELQTEEVEKLSGHGGKCSSMNL